MAETVAANPTAAEHDAVSRLVGALWGSSCRLRLARVVVRRPDYLVALLALSQFPQTVALKLAGPAASLACPFDRTAAILRLVGARTTVPVPTVLAHDAAYRDHPWRYLLTSTLPGRTWSAVRHHWTPAEQQALWGQLGGAVAALHALRFPACGEIGPDGAVIDGEDYRGALAQRARRRLSDREHLATFLDLLDRHAEIFAVPAGGNLTHEDLNHTNLLVDRDEATGHWHLSGILDFDSAWAGSGESDLARLALWDGMTGAAFWTAYGHAAPPTDDAQLRRLLLQLLWCLEYAQPTARHHVDTQHICAALGIAPFTFG